MQVMVWLQKNRVAGPVQQGSSYSSAYLSGHTEIATDMDTENVEGKIPLSLSICNEVNELTRDLHI